MMLGLQHHFDGERLWAIICEEERAELIPPHDLRGAFKFNKERPPNGSLTFNRPIISAVIVTFIVVCIVALPQLRSFMLVPAAVHAFHCGRARVLALRRDGIEDGIENVG